MRTRSTLLFLAGLSLALSYAARVDATSISDVTVSNVTQTSADVTWTTDVDSDATVNYGLDSSIGIIRDSKSDTRKHTLTIPNLFPGTTYHFRTTSGDVSGNVTATGGFVFTTAGKSSDRAVTAIKALTKPEEILAASKALQSVASDVLKPPTVLGAAKVIPDVTSAEIIWTTDRASGSVVRLEPEGTYSENSTEPYSITQGDASASDTHHDVTVIGLDPNTKYHFKVTSVDSYNLTGETADDTFTTKAAIPEIQKVALTRVSETVATVNWSTGSVLASGNVDFTNLRTRKTLSMGDPAFLSKHSVELTGLVFGTSYTVVIHATNQSGDVATSKPITFTTVRDTVSPMISKVTNQSTLFPSDNVEVQTIITWKTDEPAYCQLFYLHGVVRGANNPPSSQPMEQNPLTDHTEVMVGLSPASVYKFWVECHDASNNPSHSEDFVLITPDKQKSIVDVILQNFQGTFGWVNNIGK